MLLKEMRLQRKYTQAELAKLCGINLRSLQDYEQGHKSIASAKGETLYRLSQVLDYSIEEILQESATIIEINKDSANRQSERLLAYEKALIERKNQRVLFPLIVADEKVEMRRVYPTKQKMVKNVIDQLRGDSRLSSLRIFGSSITMRCHKDSDLDFAVELVETSDSIKNEISEKIQLACDWTADIIWFDRITSEDRIYKDIMEGLKLI